MGRFLHELKIIACLGAAWLAVVLAIAYVDLPPVALAVARGLGNLVDRILLGFPAGVHTTFWIQLYEAALCCIWGALIYGMAFRILFGSLRLKRLVLLCAASFVVFGIGGWLVVDGQMKNQTFIYGVQILYFLVGILIVRAWPAGPSFSRRHAPLAL